MVFFENLEELVKCKKCKYEFKISDAKLSEIIDDGVSKNAVQYTIVRKDILTSTNSIKSGDQIMVCPNCGTKHPYGF